MGFVQKCPTFSVKNGTYSKGDIVHLSIMGIIGILLGIVFAGIFDIFIMGEPFDKIAIQVGGAIIADVLVFFILGLPIVLGLVKANKKNTQLKVEK